MAFPAEVAEKLLDRAAAAGVDREAMFGAAAVDPGVPLTYSRLCALYEAGARLTRDDAFGLHVGERTRAEDYGLLGYAAAHSLSFGEALERLVSLQAVWTESVAFELRRGRGKASLTYRATEAPPPELRRQECEQMIATLLTFARAGAGAGLRPAEIRFEHPAPADVGEHRRIFGCPILFGAAATAILFDARTLALPMAGADPKLGALIGTQAEQALAAKAQAKDWLAGLRSEIEAVLAAGQAPSLAIAARAVGFGPRTLQRRLGERDLRWRDVVDAVRLARAKQLLADPRLGLAQIGHEAGFSQASAFHRAFRRIEGTTPRRYRLSLLARRQGC